MRVIPIDQFVKDFFVVEAEPFEELFKDLNALEHLEPLIFDPRGDFEHYETYWASTLHYLSHGYTIKPYTGGVYPGCAERRKPIESGYFAIISNRIFQTESRDKFIEFIKSTFDFNTPFTLTDRSFIDLDTFSFANDFDEVFMLELPNLDMTLLKELGF